MLAFYLAMIDTDEERSKFEELYKKYRNFLYNFSYAILRNPHYAEDAVHDAFLSLAQNMKNIEDKTCIQIRNYLIIIVRNASLLINNRRKREVCGEPFDETFDPSDIEQEAEERDSRERLWALVKKLDVKFSDVLILRYFYGFKNKEIAAALKISLANVKIRLRRGKDALRILLEEESDHER